MTMKVPDQIFISYARADLRRAAQLDHDLQARGFSTWRDSRDLDPSQDFTGEIEAAIQGASHVVVCLTADVKHRPDSFVRREIAYALAQDEARRRRVPRRRLPLIPVVFPGGELPVQISTWTAIFLSDGPGYESGFEELLERLGEPARAQEEAARYDDPPELVAYLNALHEWTSARLQESVHRLHAVEAAHLAGAAEPTVAPLLALATSPSSPGGGTAASMAAGSSEPMASEPLRFASFDQAFSHYGGRVLLLGAPGAGKTTTLLAFARDAAVARLNDRNEPVPILADIHSWDAMAPIPLWAEAQARARTEVDFVDLPDHRLYLLDGLDELGDPNSGGSGRPTRRREWFLQRVHEQLRTASVVVTSRTSGYQRRPLLGAVELQPLDEEQIRDYLVAYGCSPLWQALEGDPSLLALARTPLLLSLLAVAFKGTEDGSPPDLADFDEADIFDRYIHRRFLHEMERSRALAFDEAVARKKLGQLAVWMWQDPTCPKIQIQREDMEEVVLGPGAGRFAAFSDEMHLLQASGDRIRFIHLKLRDYCAAAYLLESLHSEDFQERADAARRLGTLGDPAVIPSLERLWHDESASVRKRAAEALTALGWRPVDTESRVRHLIGLGRWRRCLALGPAAVQGLLVALNHSDWHVRRGAVETLGKLRDVAAVAKLRGALRDRNDPVRRAAARALGRIGDRSATPDLVEALGHTDKRSRMEAAVALGRLRETAAVTELLTRLHDSKWLVRRASAEALGKIGESSALAGLLEARHDKDRRVREASVRALGRISDDGVVVAALCESLSDQDRGVRQAAMEKLAWIAGADDIEAILGALRDADRRIHGPAAKALARIGEPAVPGLSRLLDEADWHVIKRVIGVLAEVRSSAAIAELVARTRTADRRVRRAAVEALGEMGAETAVPSLLTALEDRVRSVSRAAAGALKKIGSPAVPDLVRLLDTEDGELRRAGAEILRGIGWRPVDTGTRRAYLRATGRMDLDSTLGTADVPGLVDGLRDANVKVRRNAVETLGEIGDVTAAPALIDAVSDGSRVVRKKAVEALRAIGSEASSDLAAALGTADARTRRKVAEILQEIAWRPPDTDAKILFHIAAGQWSKLIRLGAAAVSGLLAELSSSDAAAQGSAAATLAEIGGEEVRCGLSEALRHERAETRRAAAKALRKMGWHPPDAKTEVVYSIAAGRWRDCVALGASAVPALVGALADADGAVRNKSAKVLGEIGSSDAQAALVGCLRHEQGETRRAAARALKKSGWRPPDVGTEVMYHVAEGRWRDCAALGVSAAPGLLEALAHADSTMRSEAARTLGKVGDSAPVKALLAALKDEAKADVRRAIIEALGELGGSEALEGVAAGLQDESRQVRQTAARVLKARDAPAPRDQIDASEQQDRTLFVATNRAKRTLGRLLDTVESSLRQTKYVATESRDFVEEVVSGEWIDDVRSEFWSLPRGQTLDIPAPEWLDELIERVWEPFVRAGKAMAEVGASGSTTGATGFWQDPENPVYQLVALYEMQKLSSLADVGKAAEAVTMPTLLAALQDEDQDVRKKAAASLGEIGSSLALPHLCLVLLRDREADVRRVAARALGEIGDPLAIPGLRAGLRDQDAQVRRASIVALRRIGTPAALAAIDENQNRSGS